MLCSWPNYFEPDQNQLFTTELYLRNPNFFKKFLIRPKNFQLVQNSFEHIEWQGINLFNSKIPQLHPLYLSTLTVLFDCTSFNWLWAFFSKSSLSFTSCFNMAIAWVFFSSCSLKRFAAAKPSLALATFCFKASIWSKRSSCFFFSRNNLKKK